MMTRVKKECSICNKKFNHTIIYKGLFMCHPCYLIESGIMPFPLEPMSKVLNRVMNKTYKVCDNGSIYVSRIFKGLRVKVIPVELLPQ